MQDESAPTDEVPEVPIPRLQNLLDRRDEALAETIAELVDQLDDSTHTGQNWPNFVPVNDPEEGV